MSKQKARRDPAYALEQCNAGIQYVTYLTTLFQEFCQEGLPKGALTRDIVKDGITKHLSYLQWTLTHVRGELEAMK